MSKTIKIGDKVRFVDRKAHKQTPEYYPSVGTIGTVVMDECNPKDWKIQWPKGTTSGDDRWYCGEKSIELFDGKIEKDEMTNEEIWKMLKPKMEKNNVLSEPGVLCQGEDKLNKLLDTGIIDGKYVTDVYPAETVQYAIAIAYRSGYERAMKGRPFKFGEKKKKGGHWEPVDPENLPKEGTRVRYARECEDYKRHDDWIQLNDTGVVEVKAAWFGMVLDTPRGWMKWVCFDDAEDCLDMWVEDDE